MKAKGNRISPRSVPPGRTDPAQPPPLGAREGGFLIPFTTAEVLALNRRLFDFCLYGADERAAESAVRKIHAAAEASR